jgi:CubicO group peptidase (beta-lactamase class C family)
MTQMSKREALRLAVALAVMAITVPAAAQQAGNDWRLPSDDEIRGLIAARNAPRPGQGIVIGILGPEGERIVAGGTGAGARFDSTTVFEIGSITKVFTALLLADMANKGEVSLDDPAAKYLPAGHRMPERGRPITLTDLATHRSGLPRMADDMWAISHPDGQFADYAEERLLAFLDRHQLTREPGAQFEYSNLGMGLVGYLLTRAAGSDYETLVRERITAPLGMKDTMITLPPGHAARLAAPLDAYMRPVKPIEMAALAGAGAIRSTAADMLIFARALLDPHSPIAPALKTALAVRTPGENRFEQALGWVVRRLPGRELLMHDGQSYGFSSILILEPAKGRAVVALVNSAAEPGPEDLAFNIVGGQPVLPTPAVPPAPPPFVPRTAISLPVAALDKVAGRYDFGAGFVVAITRDGGYLYAHAQREGVPGGRRLQIVPEAPLAFFWKAMDAQIRFTTDAGGMVTGAVVIDRGKQMVGRRVAP